MGRGYRNNPRLTAERFVTLTLQGETVRAYRTGDLVRLESDGTLQFEGRIDSQVKVRGYRVELGGIEAALVRHPKVKESAVIPEDYGLGDRRLIAFIVSRDKKRPGTAELRESWKDKLPGYMIPNQFVFLDRMPVTQNGKTDRLLLRRLAAERRPAHVAAPLGVEDGLETELLAIWRRIPGFESIGAGDNFFAVGGHSLLAAKLLSAISERFDIELPLTTLFEAPTVRELASVIRAGRVFRPASPLVPIRKQGSRPPLFCVHGIGGNVLTFERLAFHLSAEQPVYGLQARGLGWHRTVRNRGGNGADLHRLYSDCATGGPVSDCGLFRWRCGGI